MQVSEKLCILGIVGATASGKTALSLPLAQRLKCEIVCLDSMQIYRNLDIGTAKPSAAERKLIPHHMLDILPADASFSVAEYVSQAHAVIGAILARGHIPLLVGGTGLYLQGLSLPMDYGGLPSDAQVRARFQQMLLEIGAPALHEKLRHIDPETAARLHPNDTRRIIRALEIYDLTGIPMSAHRTPQEEDAPYRFLLYATDWPRPQLHARINRRVDEMVEQGLEDEVRSLLDAGLSPQAQSMQGIGYKEWLPVFDGSATCAQAIENIKTNTRNYARRQLIWFRRDKRIRWLPGDAPDAALQTICHDWEAQ